MLPVRSVVGEERMVVEERLRLCSMMGGRFVWVVDIPDMMCCVLLYRDIPTDRASEMEDALAWTRAKVQHVKV